MNTKALCIIVSLLTILIFWGNHSATRNGLTGDGCVNCQCEVTMKILDPNIKDDKTEKPSCSVVFTYGNFMNLKLSKLTVQQMMLTDSNYVDACHPVFYCDRNRALNLKCGKFGGKTEFTTMIRPGQACTVKCEERGGVKELGIPLEYPDKIHNITCDDWVRPIRKPAPKPVPKPAPKPVPKTAPKPVQKNPGYQWQASPLLAGFFGAAIQPDIVSTLTPAKYIYEPDDEREPNVTITKSVLWWLRDGEAGIENGTLTVASGEASARSFCTGDTVRLVGPGSVSIPDCQVDATGSWEGPFAIRLPDGNLGAVTIGLKLRKEAETLKGEISTPDGTFVITTVYQSGPVLNLQADGTVAGKPWKIALNGKLIKGEITITGLESSPGEKSRRLKGFVRRLYIADTALPTAVADQPYNFALTAISPTGQDITFRLATPTVVVSQPTQISLNESARSLRGRDGETFTYSCPPGNLSINPTIYGTDVYTYDSSICTAAVHSGLINRLAGGVVTIQIKPDAGSYTASTRNGIASRSYGAYKGSYVFVKSESVAGARGRLPRGMSFDSQSGKFSGTPTETGSFEISVVADDGAGTAFEQPLTLTVKKLVVTNRLLLNGYVGQPYSAILTVAGGQPPFRFSGTMPSGFRLDPSTGELSGQPSSALSNTYFVVKVSDSQNNSEDERVTFSIRGATITNSAFLPDAKVGVPYRAQFKVIGTQSPVNWMFGEDDASSIGLMLNESTGELTGTPTTMGDFFLEVRAEAGSSVPTRYFSLSIK